MADVRGLLQTTYENGWTDRVLAEHLEASDLQITRWQLGRERPDSPAVLSLALDHLLEQGQEPDNNRRRRDWEPVVHRASGGTGAQTGPAGFPHGGSESLGVGEGSARPVGVSVASPGRGGGSPGGEAEGVGQGQGGASLPEGEAAVWLCQGALPGLGEEHAASGVVAGTEETDGSRRSSGGIAAASAGPNQAPRPFQAPAVLAGAKSEAADIHQHGQKAGHIRESWPIKYKTGRTRLVQRIPRFLPAVGMTSLGVGMTGRGWECLPLRGGTG